MDFLSFLASSYWGSMTFVTMKPPWLLLPLIRSGPRMLQLLHRIGRLPRRRVAAQRDDELITGDPRVTRRRGATCRYCGFVNGCITKYHQISSFRWGRSSRSSTDQFWGPIFFGRCIKACSNGWATAKTMVDAIVNAPTCFGDAIGCRFGLGRSSQWSWEWCSHLRPSGERCDVLTEKVLGVFCTWKQTLSTKLWICTQKDFQTLYYRYYTRQTRHSLYF